MARLTKVKVASARVDAPGVRAACLVLIYPSGPEMGSRYLLTDVSLIIGRDPSSEIVLNNLFVSRHHARIQPSRDGYEIIDLHSTNGTLVNEVRVTAAQLTDGDYVQIGNCIFRFLEGGNIEAQYHEEIHRLSIMDALTGLYNQRHFLDTLDHELMRTINSRRPLALAMFDLDHFKAINDQLGHLGGDYTLREMAYCLKELIHDPDVFVRYGGEEFAVIMPDTTLELAVQRAECLRQAVAEHPFCYDNKPYPLTISIGVAATSGEPLSPREFIRLADEKLYEAKEAGRNCVKA